MLCASVPLTLLDIPQIYKFIIYTIYIDMHHEFETKFKKQIEIKLENKTTQKVSNRLVIFSFEVSTVVKGWSRDQIITINIIKLILLFSTVSYSLLSHRFTHNKSTRVPLTLLQFNFLSFFDVVPAESKNIFRSLESVTILDLQVHILPE